MTLTSAYSIKEDNLIDFYYSIYILVNKKERSLVFYGIYTCKRYRFSSKYKQ